MVIILLIPFLMFGVGVYILRLGSLQIKNVEVEGASALNSEEIEKNVLEQLSGAYMGLVPKTSLFLVDENSLEGELMKKFGRLSRVHISKSVSGTLTANIKERIASSVWCSRENDCYLMDAEGLLFTRASQADLQDKIIFRGGISGSPLSQKFGEGAELANYVELIDLLKADGVETKSLYVESVDKTTLYTGVGDIIFMPQDSKIKTTAENVLLLISTERAKNPNARFEYIDARFGNKLFYKVI